MFDYSPSDAFATARLLDTSDPVLGGISGQSNEPLIKLADRTEWLRNRMGHFLGQRIITSASDSISVADVFKLVKVTRADNGALTLDAVSGFKPGAIITIKAKITATVGKSISLTPAGADVLEDGNKTYSVLHICDGEQVTLMAGDANADGTADYWELIDFHNYDNVGQDELRRFQPRNTIIANGANPETAGALLVRADLARLAAIVLPTAIPDSLWLSDIRYRQFWSIGNGTTTMRPPDMRSMVVKGLDLGRGLSLTRLDAVAGGLELDAVKSHDHTISGLKRNDSSGGAQPNTAYNGSDNGALPFSPLIKTDATGGVENLIKTTGFIPVIYY